MTFDTASAPTPACRRNDGVPEPTSSDLSPRGDCDAPLRPEAAVSMAHIGPDHPQRDEVEAYIARIYRERHAARLAAFLPHLLAWRDVTGRLQAAAGLRAGGEGPLFVEQYLDMPAEAAVAAVAGVPVTRGRIVEVGNFAAAGAGEARALILRLTVRLHAAGFRWVLFAATRQLRNAFDRMHLATVELAEADPQRLAPTATDWGRYYETHPRLMCGDIAAGHAWLERTGQVPLATGGTASHVVGLPGVVLP